MHFAIIKGSVKDAIVAANMHGVRVVGGTLIGKYLAGLVVADDEVLDQWFIEDVGRAPRAGSLMFWRAEEDGE